MSAIGPQSANSIPLVSVSLVTFNGAKWLERCLSSVSRQDFQDFELLVFDNASTDGTIGLLRSWLAREPRLRLEESAQNVGYAAGHNQQIRRARGEFVLLLNQDVELDPSFLRHAINAFTKGPRLAAVQGRLRRLGSGGEHHGVLDSTGLQMGRSRRTVARRQGERETARDWVPGPVWGADGPAPVYRRFALLDVQESRRGSEWAVLDEDFFMYKEDVDLAWRLRRAGWMAWYEPQALAWHARGAGAGRPTSPISVLRSRWSISHRILELSWRNQHLMQLKNERAVDLARDFLPIAMREIASLAFLMTTDPMRLGALRSFVRAIPATLSKRRMGTYSKQQGR